MALKKYFGTKKYYKAVFRIMLPILLQNVITNFVNLLDNIMVGQVGTEQMSAVAIASQAIFIFNLCIFGGLAGIGIFTAQFAGKGDDEGIRHTFRVKLFVFLAATIIFEIIFATAADFCINAFIHEGSEGIDMLATYNYSLTYLRIMMIQLPLFGLSQVFATTLRECNETVLPMKASIIATLVNLVGNYLLIFGKLGCPKLGVAGAAIATVIARLVECLILIIYTCKKSDKFRFIKGVFKTFKIPKALLKDIAKKGIPLLINELLWSAGTVMLNQCYSLRGLEVVSATNISGTVFNLFCCASMAMGSTIAIMIGQKLGAGKLEEAYEDDMKLIVLSLMIAVVIGVIMVVLAKPIASIYNTTDDVKALATAFLIIIAILMPFTTYTNVCYFTLRCGGKTVITFLFDSVCTWVFYVPTAFVLTRFTGLEIITIYAIVNCIELIKGAVGFFMVRSKKWIVNLVADKKEKVA